LRGRIEVGVESQLEIDYLGFYFVGDFEKADGERGGIFPLQQQF